eukprot:5108909-Pyramimonas_sp.AAC.1
MRDSTEGPGGRVRMASQPSLRHAPRMLRGPMWDSTEDPGGRVRMARPPPLWHTLHTLRGGHQGGQKGRHRLEGD